MSTKLIESSFEKKRDIARVTTRQDAVPIKTVPTGTEFEYTGYVLQEICNENTGEVFNSILIAAADGKVYATRSETFIEGLKEIIEICADDEEPIIIRINRSTSRNGREFVSCSLV